MLESMETSELQLFAKANLFDEMTDKQIRILTAAVEIFAKKGYANSSTKEIAQRAGVSEGNLFNHFKNKRGLLDAIIQPVIHSIFPTVLTDFDVLLADNQPLTLQHFIESITYDRAVFLRENCHVLKIFISEMSYSADLRAQFIATFPQKTWHDLNQTLDQLKAQGELVNWDNLAIMNIFWSLLGGLMVGQLLFDQPITETSLQHTTTALVKALQP